MLCFGVFFRGILLRIYRLYCHRYFRLIIFLYLVVILKGFIVNRLLLISFSNFFEGFFLGTRNAFFMFRIRLVMSIEKNIIILYYIILYYIIIIIIIIVFYIF